MAFFHAAFDVILIYAHAPVVFIAAEQEFAVEPDLPRVLAAEAQFDRPIRFGHKLGVEVRGDAFEFAIFLIDVDHAVGIFGSEIGRHRVFV